MSRAPTSNSHKQAVDRHGQTVDLTNFTADTDERVETWTSTSSSPHSITARVVPRNTPSPSRDVGERGEVDVDVRVHIKDGASGAGSIRDGGGQGASRIDTNQDGTDNLLVLTKTDLQNGVIRLDCERIE